jgi:hypothetical protein
MVKLEKTTSDLSFTLETFGLSTALTLFIIGILSFYLASVVLVIDYIDVLNYKIVSFFLFSVLTSNLISRVIVGFVKHAV